MSDTPDITRTIEEILESYAKYQYQLHVDNDGTIQLNKREAVHKLVTLYKQGQIDLLSDLIKKYEGASQFSATYNDLYIVREHLVNLKELSE